MRHTQWVSEAEIAELKDIFVYLTVQRSDISLTDISSMAGRSDEPGWADSARRNGFKKVSHQDYNTLRRSVKKLLKGNGDAIPQYSKKEIEDQMARWTGKPRHAPATEDTSMAARTNATTKKQIAEMRQMAETLITSHGIDRNDIAQAAGFAHWKSAYQALYTRETTSVEKYEALKKFFETTVANPEGATVDADAVVASLYEEDTAQEEVDARIETGDVYTQFRTEANNTKKLMWQQIERFDSLNTGADPVLKPAIDRMRDRLLELYTDLFEPARN